MNTLIGYTIICVIVIFIITSVICDNIKYKKFKAKLQPNTKLSITYYDKDINLSVSFTITILKTYEHQVLAEYSDHSTSTFSKQYLYYEGWKVLPNEISS